MELTIFKSERMAVILVVMGQRVVALRHVEAEDGEAYSADQLLLEGTLLLVCDGVRAC